MDDTSKYVVGYKKPPVETRFQPGRSGNPRGRPRGSKNHDTLLIELLHEPAASPKRTKKKPRLEALVVNLVDRALNGDTRALVRVFNLMQELDTKAEPVPPPRGQYCDFEAVLEYVRSQGWIKEPIPCSSAGNFPVRHAWADQNLIDPRDLERQAR